MDLAAFRAAVEKYVRPATEPVGIKLLKAGEPLPEKIKEPAKDLGKKIAICQANSLARKYGWTVALGAEDQACPIGSVIMGFAAELPFYSEGNLAQGMYTKTLEAGVCSEQAVRKFAFQEYEKLLVGALNRLQSEPDVVLVYGNAAQVMRLVHAALYEAGGAITSSFTGRGECSEIIVQTVQSNACQVVLPGNGERVFGQTQDDEMAFTIPASRVDAVAEGLAGTHRGGVRFPIPNYLLYEPQFPPKYQQLQKLWQDKD